MMMTAQLLGCVGCPSPINKISIPPATARLFATRCASSSAASFARCASSFATFAEEVWSMVDRRINSTAHDQSTESRVGAEMGRKSLSS